MSREPKRVAAMSRPHRLIYEWLRHNGINEWLPEQSQMVINHPGKTVTISRFVWKPGTVDRWNADNVHVAGRYTLATEDATVPLHLPPSDAIRAALAKTGTRVLDTH